MCNAIVAFLIKMLMVLGFGIAFVAVGWLILWFCILKDIPIVRDFCREVLQKSVKKNLTTG